LNGFRRQKIGKIKFSKISYFLKVKSDSPMVTGLGRCVIIFELVSVRGWGLVCNAWVRDESRRLYCFVIGGCKFALAAQRLSDTLSGPLWLRFRVRDF